MRAPSEATADVQAFCMKLAGHADARAIEIAPLPNADVLDCFSVLEQTVATLGGEMILGWRISEYPGFWLEAELHAVWRRPNGTMVDPTPAQLPTDYGLFLPDETATYSGRQVNDRFWPLSQHPAINRFIALQAERFELMNRGARADEHGHIVLPPAQGMELERIERAALGELNALEEARQWTAGRNEGCPCGSGQKYKRCCLPARLSS